MIPPAPGDGRACARQAVSSDGWSRPVVGSSRSQIGRCATRSRASDSRRRCPAESTPAGKSRKLLRARSLQARSALPPPRESPVQKREIFLDRERRLDAIADVPIEMRLLADGADPHRRLPVPPCPPAARMSPAMSRRSVVLPAPLGPVSASELPRRCSRNSSPLKTTRPPRSTVRPFAAKPHQAACLPRSAERDGKGNPWCNARAIVGLVIGPKSDYRASAAL